jgi:hypothetical protein
MPQFILDVARRHHRVAGSGNQYFDTMFAPRQIVGERPFFTSDAKDAL